MKEKGAGDLHDLDFGQNDLTDKSCKPLALAMLENKEIRRLSLYKAEITEKTINVLYKSMSRDHTLQQLTHLNLRDTMVKPDLVKDINELIRKNTYSVNEDVVAQLTREHTLFKSRESQNKAEKRRMDKLAKLKNKNVDQDAQFKD